MKRYGKLKQLAEKLHKLFHRVQEGKNPTHKDFDYYTAGFAYFDKRFDDLEKSIKEISKQQKYLWQTLEERDVVHAVSDEKLCPCGHEHKPRSDGRGLRTYCVKGSQCNSDKCKEFVSVAKEEQ